MVAAGLAFGMTAYEAAIMVSIIVTICLIFFVLLATKGKRPDITMPLMGMLSFVFWIFLGWFPSWAGAVIAMLFAYMLAKGMKI
jgi:hypothetical protein